MTTQQVADRLVELGRSGQLDNAYGELFSPSAASYEAPGVPNGEVHGLDNLLKKSAAWAADVAELHELTISDPIVGGDHFAVSMFIDLTKKSGGREKAAEICVYKVVDGKITEERFFYGMPG